MSEKNILWVDDDEDLKESLTPLLEMEGWRVTTAGSAEEGKVKAERERPDLIIMDVMMDGEHGFDATEELKSNPLLANVPVILYSGVTGKWKETTATREDAVLTEANEFIDKSKDPEVLIDAIKKHLGE